LLLMIIWNRKMTHHVLKKKRKRTHQILSYLARDVI
jgi:hypothetical protein